MSKADLSRLGRELDRARRTYNESHMRRRDQTAIDANAAYKDAFTAFNAAREAYTVALEDITGQSADAIISRLRC